MTGRRRSLIAFGLLTSCFHPIFIATASETIGYSYDERGRLIKVSHSGTVSNGVTACYSYDKADNRSNVTVETAADCGASPPPPSFSINNVSVAEDGGTITFTVSRSGSTAGSYTVNYATANNTATAGSDYIAKSGTLTFVDGDVSEPISVTITNDTTAESTESFYVDLSNASGGATIVTSRGTGTITDNDSPCAGITFSIASNGAVTEGANSGFTISKAGSTANSCSINYATANGSAVAPGDYTAKSTTALTFTSGQNSQTVNVTTINDSTVESPETFTMTLSSPSGGAAIGTTTATATINSDDVAGSCTGVSFTISSDGFVNEGGTETLTITKAGSTSSSCDIYYATANVTATAPSDYTAKPSTKLTFTSAQSSKSVSVVTLQDAAVEGPETFTMSLSNPSGGATLGAPNSKTVTIGDDDEPPPEQCYDEGGRPIPCD